MKFLFPFFIIVLISCKGNHTLDSETKSYKKPLSIDSANKDEKGIVKWIRYEHDTNLLLPTTARQFVSVGRKALYWVEGDINNDGLKDLTLVTTIENENDYTLDTTIIKRELVLLIGLPDNSFRIAAKNMNAVAGLNSYGMSPDSFAGIQTGTGQFTLLFYGGSNWKDTRASTFKYDATKKIWILDREIIESFSMNWQDYTVDTLTKKDFGFVSFPDFDIYKIMEIEE